MAQQPCVIGKSVTIRGTISGADDLAVEGRISGSITLTGGLLIDQGGMVEADVEAEQLEVRGQLHGDVRSVRAVSIRTGAAVVGTIAAPTVIIEEGAHYNGRIEMEIELPADFSARR